MATRTIKKWKGLALGQKAVIERQTRELEDLRYANSNHEVAAVIMQERLQAAQAQITELELTVKMLRGEQEPRVHLPVVPGDVEESQALEVALADLG